MLLFGQYGGLRPDALFFGILITLNWRTPLARLFRVGSVWQKGLISLRKFDEGAPPPEPSSPVKISPNGEFRLSVHAPGRGIQSFSIANSEFRQICIPSERDKSALLRLLAGLGCAPDIAIMWNERPAANYASRQLRCLMTFVSDAFPLTGLTLLDDLRQNINEEANRAAAERFALWQSLLPPLAELDLSARMRDLHNELSLAQQILLQFVRADIADRPMVVLDDPFAFLDDITCYRLRGFLNEIWSDRAILYLSKNEAWEWERRGRGRWESGMWVRE